MFLEQPLALPKSAHNMGEGEEEIGIYKEMSILLICFKILSRQERMSVMRCKWCRCHSNVTGRVQIFSLI